MCLTLIHFHMGHSRSSPCFPVNSHFNSGNVYMHVLISGCFPATLPITFSNFWIFPNLVGEKWPLIVVVIYIFLIMSNVHIFSNVYSPFAFFFFFFWCILCLYLCPFWGVDGLFLLYFISSLYISDAKHFSGVLQICVFLVCHFWKSILKLIANMIFPHFTGFVGKLSFSHFIRIMFSSYGLGGCYYPFLPKGWRGRRKALTQSWSII